VQAKRVLVAITLYAGWLLAGLLGAVVLTFLFACAYDPHGNGPVGEGLIFLFVLALLTPVGLTLGYLRASVIWRKRNAQPVDSN
jgi:hypothetical protein